MNAFSKLALSSLSAGLLFSTGLGLAEDIDIYAGDTGPATNPNILLIIDNSANWASASQHWPGGIKQGEAELNAIRTVVSEVGEDVNISLMLLTGGSGSNYDGGYVRYHMRAMDATNKSAFSELIGNPLSCTAGDNSLNGTPNCIYQNFNGSEKTASADTDYSAAMFEAFKYFGGFTNPANATTDVGGSPTDATHYGRTRYAGDPDAKTDPGAFTDATLTTYTEFLNEYNSCAKNYIVFIGNGFPSQDAPATLLSGVGGDTTQLAMPEFTVAGVTETDILDSIPPPAGGFASVADCESWAASEAGYGAAYESYSCTGTTYSSGTSYEEAASFGTSLCGQYADAGTCQSALATLYPGYDTYVCSELAACTYTETLSPSVLLNNQATCIGTNQASTCTGTLAPALYPNYASFSCTDDIKSDCTGNERKWVITAAEANRAGKTFSLAATRTVTATTESTSYTIEGTRTVTAVEPTGATSLPADSKVRYADEWARFLHRTDVSAAMGQQRVTTYAIDAFKDQQDADQTRLLMSMARAGGGKYFAASDEDAIKNALREIFSEIQSVNSVFASSSLPVSVNTQGTYLNQVFVGMFRPDGSAKPRWAGNLKQYQFKFFADRMKLADDNGDEALSPTTGFVTPCADSIWTSASGKYWDYAGSDAEGSCTSSDEVGGAYSDGPDGDVVEKGGAGQRLRGVGLAADGVNHTTSTNYATRNLKTCAPTAADATACGALTSFDSANAAITAAALGTTDADRTDLIDWVRGKDVDDENSNGVYTEVRPSVHGGVIHSQPAVVDFGGNVGVVAFYGADDGVFHAVNGGTDADDGNELWGFIAPETYGRLKRQRVNEPWISFPLDSLLNVTPAPEPKDYFFDGSIGVFQRSGTAWIFPSMRRGGRAIYAFDVSNPATPVLKWRKGCFTSSTTSDASCTAGWSGIGQTWSKPLVAYLKGHADGDTPRPVLVFGGGYDTCEDADSAFPCTAGKKGSNIWFVDADTGAILRTYPTNYSVPGDIALLTDRASGYLKYAYAVDTGGYVYRINVGTDVTAFTGWSGNAAASDITIASLAGGKTRKFLYGPDVVPYRGYNAVLAGTGDREHPLVDSYACADFADGLPKNRFYMVKDTPDAYPASPIDTLMDVTNDTDATEEELADADGWFFELGACEQVVNKPLTFGGIVFFGTNQPAETIDSCGTNLGVARGYSVDFLTGNPAVGSGRSVTYVGGGLPPSPVAGVVDVDGEKQPFIIGGSKPPEDGSADEAPSPLEGSKVEINPTATRTRTYWYKEID